MITKIKTIFMGTPQLAAIGLQALLDSDFFNISAVVTQQDKSSGRNMRITKSAVKILAEKNNLKILQPHKLKEIIEDIKEIKPDLIIVIAYGKILSEEILSIPKYGCLNVHGSLLPKHRGASCLQGAILSGDKKSGITIMKMDKGMDTGDIIKKIEIELEDQETSASLMEKIQELTSKNLTSTIQDYLKGKIKLQPQNNAEASYVQMIKKEDGHLNFEKDTALEIERKIRAYFPWPGSYAFIEKNDLPKTKILFKILKSNNNFIGDESHQPGAIFLKDNLLLVKCIDKALIIEKLQLEGKKPMEAKEFLKGNDWVIGKTLQ